MIFRKLAQHHDRKRFDCGVESVNRYLQQSARQHAEKDIALTYVLAEREDSPEIRAFYTLLMNTVSCDIVPIRGLPRGRTAPVVLLAQLGVDLRFQGCGHGRDLLYHALSMSKEAADRVGCLAVVLNAVDDKARGFYEKRGFLPLEDDPYHLWLPMSAVRNMFTTGS